MKALNVVTLDNFIRVEHGDPLGGDGGTVRVEVVEVALGVDEGEPPHQHRGQHSGHPHRGGCSLHGL